MSGDEFDYRVWWARYDPALELEPPPSLWESALHGAVQPDVHRVTTESAPDDLIQSHVDDVYSELDDNGVGFDSAPLIEDGSAPGGSMNGSVRDSGESDCGD